MSTAVQVKVNEREWRDTIRKYQRVSRRTSKEITDSKAYFIARGAIDETHKANKLAIGKELSKVIFDFKNTATGSRRSLKTSTRFGRWGQTHQVPIAALLVNWKRGQMGKPGLFGEAMKQAVQHFIANRQRSVAFLRSGWLPALRILSPFVKSKAGAVPLDPETKRHGEGKGSATPASEGAKARTVIVNSVGESGHHSEAVEKYAVPGLQKSFDNEKKSMLEYIEDKLRAAAHEAGIKTN